jgi:glycosyltransferase 2 family protein
MNIRAIPWKRLASLAIWLVPLFAIFNIIVLITAMRGPVGQLLSQSPYLLVCAAIMALIPMTAEMLRLRIWSRFLGVPTRFSGAAQIIGGTMIANMLTPSSTGSPAIKWGLMRARGVPSDKASTMLSLQVTEDAFVIISLLTICVSGVGVQRLAALLQRPELQGLSSSQILTILAGITAFFATVISILYWLKRSGRLGFVARFRRRIRIGRKRVMRDWRQILRRGKSIAAMTISLAIVQWSVRYSVITAVIVALDGRFQPLLYWGLQWLTMSLAALVPTPGGVGGAEAAFLALYSPFMGGARLLAAMAAWRLLLYYWPTMVAGIGLYVFRAIDRRRARMVNLSKFPENRTS